MEWIILLFVCFVLIGAGFVLRQRHRAQREAEHARAQAFLLAIQGGGLLAGTSVAPDADLPLSCAADTEPVAADMPRPSNGSGRGYLDRRHQVVWRWLRTALPEAEIFARGSLRRVVGRDRVQKDMMLDFVICNAHFEVLAAVDIHKDGQSDPGAAFKRMLLDEAGVRYTNWDPTQLPAQAELRRWLDWDDARPRRDQITR